VAAPRVSFSHSSLGFFRPWRAEPGIERICFSKVGMAFRMGHFHRNPRYISKYTINPALAQVSRISSARSRKASWPFWQLADSTAGSFGHSGGAGLQQREDLQVTTCSNPIRATPPESKRSNA